MGFDFETLNKAFSPPANKSDFSRRDLQFVMSQIQENNFVDHFVPKHTQYTRTKIKKVKKHNSTPLKINKCHNN